MKPWITYPILCSVGYYLLSRALITKFLWSRYPKKLDAFMSCASCLGFWLGLAIGIVFSRLAGWSFLGIPPENPLNPLMVAIFSIWWTPVAAYIQIYALSAVDLPESTEENNGN